MTILSGKRGEPLGVCRVWLQRKKISPSKSLTSHLLSCRLSKSLCPAKLAWISLHFKVLVALFEHLRSVIRPPIMIWRGIQKNQDARFWGGWSSSQRHSISPETWTSTSGNVLLNGRIGIVSLVKMCVSPYVSVLSTLVGEEKDAIDGGTYHRCE